MGRKEPLEVYGPKGIKAMTEHVLKAWQIDIDVRTNGINQHSANGFKVNAHEIAPGVDLPGPQRHGHGIPGAARGAGRFLQLPVRYAGPRHRDFRRHHAHPGAHRTQPRLRCSRPRSLFDGEFSPCLRRAGKTTVEAHHTSSAELAEIANAVKPGLLVLYHRSNAGGDPANLERDEVVVEEIRQAYKGKVVQGHDLDIF